MASDTPNSELICSRELYHFSLSLSKVGQLNKTVNSSVSRNKNVLIDYLQLVLLQVCDELHSKFKSFETRVWLRKRSFQPACRSSAVGCVGCWRLWEMIQSGRQLALAAVRGTLKLTWSSIASGARCSSFFVFQLDGIHWHSSNCLTFHQFTKQFCWVHCM